MDVEKRYTYAELGHKENPRPITYIFNFRIWHLYAGVFAIGFCTLWGAADIVARVLRALGH